MLKKNLIYIIILAAGITAAISAGMGNKSDETNATSTATTVTATSTTPVSTTTPTTEPVKPATTTPTTPVQAKCHVGGCSGEICSDQEGLVSNCMYREAYGCYKSTGAKCERQTTGKCGWTETSALSMCIKAADASGSGTVY